MGDIIPAKDAARVIEFDFVRATEAAALNALNWLGKGDKEAADAAASDAMRGMLSLIEMRGRCVIGEGIKDAAPGIFAGEKLGRWNSGSLRANFAVDPIDGTRLTAKGLPGAISVLAAAINQDEEKQELAEIPSFYCYKLAYGPQISEAKAKISLQDPIDMTLKTIADCLGKRINSLSVTLLDRPRHDGLIAEIRKTGVRIRMIGDGDVAAAIGTCMLDSPVDVYVGIGGSPEAVIAAAAIRCLGGQMLVRMWPRDEDELADLKTNGHGSKLRRIYTSEDLATGEEIMFAATGISDSPMLRGIRVEGNHVHTYSILMRAKYRTVRYIHAIHDLSRKTINLASDRKEHPLWRQ